MGWRDGCWPGVYLLEELKVVLFGLFEAA